MTGGPHDNRLEKVGLLILAAMGVATLAAIAVLGLYWGDKIGSEVATMLGVIITGLIAFAKDIISAIRGYAMSAQLGKVTDQLAASGPTVPPTDPPISPSPARPAPGSTLRPHWRRPVRCWWSPPPGARPTI